MNHVSKLSTLPQHPGLSDFKLGAAFQRLATSQMQLQYHIHAQGRSWRPASRARPPRRRRRSAARQAQKAAQRAVLTTRTPRCFPHGSEGDSHVCCAKRPESERGGKHIRAGVLEQTAHGVCHDSELCHKFQRPSSHVNDNSNRDRSRSCAREDRGEGGARGCLLMAIVRARRCACTCGAAIAAHQGHLNRPRARIGNARGRLWRPECTAARAASSSARWRASVCTDLPGCCCAATCAEYCGALQAIVEIRR